MDLVVCRLEEAGVVEEGLQVFFKYITPTYRMKVAEGLGQPHPSNLIRSQWSLFGMFEAHVVGVMCYVLLYVCLFVVYYCLLICL